MHKYWQTGLLLFLGLFLTSCSSTEPSDLAPALHVSERQAVTTAEGTWSSAGNMALARLLHTATVLENGQVLAVGGFNVSTEIYDPATDLWHGVADAPNPYREATATRLSSGKVLVAGESDWKSPGVSAALYDPETQTWQPTGALIHPRRQHTATRLASGKVLVVGGASGGGEGQSLATAELYDPESGLWTSTGALGTPRRNHTATVLHDGHVLVTGGTDLAGVRSSTAELYDPATGTWHAVAPMKQARTYHTATVLLGGQVLVTGGGGPEWSGGASSELYLPDTGAWITTGSMASPRRQHSAMLLPAGEVLVVGGFHEYTGIHTSAELYVPALGAWQPAGHMTVGRYQHTATLLAGGQVLVAGGFSNGYQSSAERYTPAPSASPASTSALLQVLDASGRPLPTAAIYAMDMAFAVDALGRKLFEGLSGEQLRVRVEAPGYAPAVAVVPLQAGELVLRGIRLLALGAPLSLDAGSGGTLQARQVRLTFPPQSIVDAQGNPVTGGVQVTVASLDSSHDPAALPGPGLGVREEDGQGVLLEDLLVAEVSLWSGGAPAQVAPGKTVRLEIELPDAWASSYQAGDTLPAWWLDLADYAWHEQGTGAIQPSSTNPGRLSWVVEVPHFTAWAVARSLGGMGARCNSSSQCQSGLTCLSRGVCWTLGGPWAICGRTSDCQSGLYCTAGTTSTPGAFPLSGVCKAPGSAGAICYSSSQCQSGFYCTGSGSFGGICKAPGGAGSICYSSSQCQSGLYCTGSGSFGGICKAPGGVGAHCNSSNPCQSGLSCTAGFCQNSSTGGGSGGSGGTGGTPGPGGGGTGGCDPRTGTHGQMWVNDGYALGLYLYHDVWCSVGTLSPAACWNGTYYYSQYIVNQFCSGVGSNGSCYDPDASWSVSCNSLIDCTYNCSGQCVRTQC
jgi:hypothetical protein